MSSQQQQRPSGSGMLPPSGGAVPPGRDNPACPICQRPMTVKQVSPVLFASGLDDVIYGCEDCGIEAQRTVKRI